MRLELDNYNRLDAPPFILCKPNGDRIATVACTQKKGVVKFNDCDEISFTTRLYMDGEKNPAYEKVKEFMHLEIPDMGRYVLIRVRIHSEGTNLEYKECTALSEEILLAQKYLELFTINMGTTASIDEVSFEKLLPMVLKKCPDWKVGIIDDELKTMECSFEVDRQDVYSFLTDDVANAFHCVFEFDTLTHQINAYTEQNVGEDTNIHISYANLAKTAELSYSIDSLKTCLTVTGRDDLNIREVNLGSDRIYNLDYFHSLEYMSRELYDALNFAKEYWMDYDKHYEDLSIQYREYCDQLRYYTTTMMPADESGEADIQEIADESEAFYRYKEWFSQYGLTQLQSKLNIYRKKRTRLMSSNIGTTDSSTHWQYLNLAAAIRAIQNQINARKETIAAIEENQVAVKEEQQDLANEFHGKINFSEELQAELSKFIREDELRTDNYVVVDTDTEMMRLETIQKLRTYGQEALAKASVPAMQFSMDMANLFALPELQEMADNFQAGNFIHVTLRDDFSLKVRLLAMNLNFLDKSEFSVTFGNASRLKGNRLLEHVTTALGLASASSASVSANAHRWNQSVVTTEQNNQILSDGLLSAGYTLRSQNENVILTEQGITLSNRTTENDETEDSATDKETIFIGSGQILYSTDGLSTVQTALGHISYEKSDGTLSSDYGVSARFVQEGHISNTEITNNGGTFSVDKDGKVTARDIVFTAQPGSRIGDITYDAAGTCVDGHPVRWQKIEYISDITPVTKGFDSLGEPVVVGINYTRNSLYVLVHDE